MNDKVCVGDVWGFMDSHKKLRKGRVMRIDGHEAHLEGGLLLILTSENTPLLARFWRKVKE